MNQGLRLKDLWLATAKQVQEIIYYHLCAFEGEKCTRGLVPRI